MILKYGNLINKIFEKKNKKQNPTSHNEAVELIKFHKRASQKHTFSELSVRFLSKNRGVFYRKK